MFLVYLSNWRLLLFTRFYVVNILLLESLFLTNFLVLGFLLCYVFFKAYFMNLIANY